MTDRRTASTITDTELDQLYNRLADYENRITWHTTCAACARVLDSAIRETERRERAEATLREVLDAFEAYWASASYCGPGRSAVQPEHFQAWRALLNQPAPAAGLRGLLDHVGIDTHGRDISVDGRVVDAAAPQATDGRGILDPHADPGPCRG
ncbi:hypothetical protein ACH5A3_21225 [Streptomyces echinatus]|uniref:hypothetical protein n=1 Tax=Streptomyces echinatus TaxID=67293 RepID=UPI00378E83BC